MKNQIKFKGFLKSYRLKIKKMMDYTDAEYRLWDVLIHIADWDEEHRETFGTTGESLRDIQKHYLSWSIGKLSETVKCLTKRELVVRRIGGRVEIRNFKYLISRSVRDIEQFYGADDDLTVHPDEQTVQAVEQKIHSTEQNVHLTERELKNQIDKGYTKNPLNTGGNTQPVHLGEKQNNTKETLEKKKKQQTNEDEMLLSNKLIDEYGDDIKRPLSKFSVTSVRDSARRVESRIQRGEKVKNRVGYITNLCKEGIEWEGSEEKAREDEFGAPQLEYSEIKPKGKYHRFSSIGTNIVQSLPKAPEVNVPAPIDTTKTETKEASVNNNRTPEEQARINAHLAKIKSELGAKLGWKTRNDNGAVPAPEYKNPPNENSP